MWPVMRAAPAVLRCCGICVRMLPVSFRCLVLLVSVILLQTSIACHLQDLLLTGLPVRSPRFSGPHRATLPPAPAVDAFWEDDTSDSRLVWDAAGWASPHAKFPDRPLVVLVDVSSTVWFLKFCQQTQAVHILPVLGQEQAWLDGPNVEQVECRMQLQHCPTW